MNKPVAAALRRTIKKVCLFGLSGDPPTGESGHVGIVKALMALNVYDEIHILPVYKHAFSEKRNRLVPYMHRLEMCRIAFEQLTTVENNTIRSSQSKVIVSDYEEQAWLHSVKDISNEIEKSKISVGTAALLDYYLLMDMEKGMMDTNDDNKFDIEYTFCMGSDAFFDLTEGKWKESQRILQILQGRIVVLYRKPQWTITMSSKTAISTVLPPNMAETSNGYCCNNTAGVTNGSEHNDDHIDSLTEEESILRRIQQRIDSSCHGNGEVLRVDHLNDVSSSQVRQLSTSQILSTEMITQPILQYIQRHQLYQFSPTL